MARVSSILTRIANDLEQYCPKSAFGRVSGGRPPGGNAISGRFARCICSSSRCWPATRRWPTCGSGRRGVQPGGLLQGTVRLPLAAIQTFLRESSVAMRAAMTRLNAEHRGSGTGCVRFWSMAPAPSPPIRPIYRRTFGQPTDKPGCGFPFPSSWLCLTPSPAWWWRYSDSRCTPTNNPKSRCSIRCSRAATCWWATGDFALSFIWPCWGARA